MKHLPRFSIGMGDRFGRQGEAQLSAVIAAKERGIDICPVWNKSHREHTITGTSPASVRTEADAAVAALGWNGAHFVDADHITLGTVDAYLDSCDFFTLDVADWIGRPAAAEDKTAFLQKHAELAGMHDLPNCREPVRITTSDIEAASDKFLGAVREAGRIHRKIADAKPEGDFAIEVSMDETDAPQSPAELLLILAMIADEGIPAQTIAPKFTGRFNKGVDYEGDLAMFEREFDADLGVLSCAISRLGLPASLKISVHSGSDKFSLYPVIRRLTQAHGAGLHIKTAGTTWLEELAGLAEAGGDGLDIAREIAVSALAKREQLVAPYATVVAIDPSCLPTADEIAGWSGSDFVARLEHNPASPLYNPSFRQLMHVSFKLAAAMGGRFSEALDNHTATTGRRVRANLLEKHIEPLFL